MYAYTGCASKHDDPKSTSLIADRPGVVSRMFSGFRSQCRMWTCQWHSVALSGTQRHSEALSGTQEHSEALSGNS